MYKVTKEKSKKKFVKITWNTGEAQNFVDDNKVAESSC